MNDKVDRHFRLRLPIELAEKIERSAADLRRTLNADIVARLERTFAVEESNARARAAWRAGRDPRGDVPPPDSIGDYGVPTTDPNGSPKPEFIQALERALKDAHDRTVEEVMNRFMVPSADDPDFDMDAHDAELRRQMGKSIAPDVPPAKVPAKRKSRKP